MKILFITQYFQPEVALKGLPLAGELVKRGHEVQVLTTFPSHPYGKIYPGYRQRLLQREEIEGVSILRVPLYPSHDNSGIRRFCTYTSFAVSASIIGLWWIKQVDVAYVYQPLTSCIPACLLQLLHGVPFVYDIQDLWPDSLVESAVQTKLIQNKLGLWLADKTCKFFYKAARKIIVESPGFKEILCQRGVADDKVEVIYNWCDDSNVRSFEKRPELADELGMTNKFNVVYAGNMGNVQILDSLLDAASIVQSKQPNIQFVLIGDGSELESLKKKALQMKLKNVIFHGRRPVSEIGAILSLADVLFVQLVDQPLFRITIPSKIQAYMSVGKPILIGVEGHASELVLKAKAGIKCKPGNPESIAEAIGEYKSMPQKKLEQMGRNGKKFYQENLSLEVGTKRSEEVFESVVNQHQQEQ